MEELLQRKIDFFRELLGCIPGLVFWELSPEGTPIDMDGEEPQILQALFSISGCKKYLTDYIERGESAPLVLSDTHGMSWIASFECANSYVCRVYMLGPAFNSAVSSLQIRSELQKQGYTAELTEQFCTRIDALPVIPITLWLNYGTMLSLTVTGVKPEISDFQYQIHDTGKPEEFTRQMPTNNTWIAEQEAMRAIEEGNLDYRDASANLSTHDIYSSSFSSEQQVKKLRTAMYSFIALCTRAAIRGGLVPETAYYIGEVYMDQVETCRNPTELAQINTAMFDDFVHRVHTVRSQSLSPEIQNCCAYIQKHIRENIDMEALAHATGYVEYYLTKKFKKEMGMSISEYIKRQRVSLAKDLLRFTSRSVQDISVELGFCNSSYFIRVFREITGMSPKEYRG